MRGSDYAGFLAEADRGPIQGMSFDCFAHHAKIDLSNVSFVKLDVEGFEIAVLKGAQHSLFAKGSEVGGMIIEVGPQRWNRAQVDLATGIQEMTKLFGHFVQCHLLVRTSGIFEKSCPVALADKFLSDKEPMVVESERMYKVSLNELNPLLVEMHQSGMDCNFYFANK